MKPRPVTDPDRLRALRSLYLLDTPSDRGFDELAQVARRALGVPVALISLVDRERQFLVSCPGLRQEWAERRETPLSHSFCQHVVATDGPLIVSDAREHALVRDNPAVRDLDVIAYAGVPLRTHDGFVVGTLCAIDHTPRQWQDAQIELLSRLATCVLYRIELMQTARLASAQADLLQAQAREYRDLIEHSVYAIYRSDPAGSVYLANSAFAAMLGYDGVADVIGLSLGRSIYVDEKDRLALKQRSWPGDRVGPTEVQWRKRDGGVILVRLSGRAIRDDAGDIRWYEMFAEDVTAQKALEQQLLQSRKMEAVGRLAAGVAHDFNNLLTVIRGYVGLALDEVQAGHSLHADLRQIMDAAERASGLTRQLLSFSRQQVIEPRTLDLNEAVRRTETMLRRLIGDHIRLEVDLTCSNPAIVADPTQVEQVLVNLAVNARDSMASGGRLRIQTLYAVVADEYTADLRWHILPGEYVTLCVSDTGPGIPDSILDRIFEPFFTTKPQGSGTGLGLSTVYGIVEQSGGHIRVQSTPGEGTTFCVYWPPAPATSVASPAEPEAVPRAAGTATILLVEDNDGVRSMARRTLQRDGHTILDAPNGGEALLLHQRHGRVDLLLTDLSMPYMSGRELAAMLLRTQPDLRVLFMSGFAEAELSHDGVLDEGTNFIGKPFTPDELAARVSLVLQQQR